jgi:hypothetical protein
MPPAGVSYGFGDAAKAVQAAHSPTQPAGSTQQVVVGYQLGPFTFGADSPIGSALAALSGDSQAVADANQKLGAQPGDIGSQLNAGAQTVGKLAGFSLGTAIQPALSVLGITAQTAAPQVAAGAGTLASGVGNLVTQTGVATVGGAVGGVTSGLAASVGGALSSATGGDSKVLYLGLGLVGILLLIFLLK